VIERHLEALRWHDLENVPGSDVFLHRLGHFHVLVAGHVDGRFERLDVAEDREQSSGHGAREAGFEFLDLGDGVVVGAIGMGRVGHVRIGDDLDPAFEVIENQERVGDEEIGVGHAEVILLCARYGRFKLRDGLESDVADRAAVEEREIVRRNGAVARHQTLEFAEGIVLDGVGALLSAFAQRDVFAVRLKDQVRAGAEKRVAREFVPLLHRLEKKGVVARVDFMEGGNGRFHVGDDLAINRDQVAAMGPFAEAFAGGEKTGVHKSKRKETANKPTRALRRGQSKWRLAGQYFPRRLNQYAGHE